MAVRPSRYTYEFMENGESFTVCALPSRHREALALLGSRSGRESDKIAAAGLTPIPSTRVAAPGFAEAVLIVESRKMYCQDLIPEHCPPEAAARYYPHGDYHRLYFGEILAIFGEPRFAS